MLHLLTASALSSALVQRIAAGDEVVLQHQQVWAAHLGHRDNQKLLQLQNKPCNVYLLEPHAAAYGLERQRILPGVAPISFAELVELTVKHPQIVTWC